MKAFFKTALSCLTLFYVVVSLAFTLILFGTVVACNEEASAQASLGMKFTASAVVGFSWPAISVATPEQLTAAVNFAFAPR